MNREAFIQAIRDGRFFTVTFVKRSDGQVRVMNGRFGVTQYLKGTGAAYDFGSYNLVPVYDVHKKGYRCVPADGVLELKAHGKTVYKRDPLP